LFKRKKNYYSTNSFDPSLFLFLLLLFSFSFSLSSIFIKPSKKTWKKKKYSFFYIKRNANQEDGTSFPPRKSYLKKKKKQYQPSFLFEKKHLLELSCLLI